MQYTYTEDFRIRKRFQRLPTASKLGCEISFKLLINNTILQAVFLFASVLQSNPLLSSWRVRRGAALMRGDRARLASQPARLWCVSYPRLPKLLA